MVFITQRLQNVTTRRVIFAVVLARLAVAAPVYGDIEAGLGAARRGDFETALKEWGPLAEQGVARARYNFGVMYDNGDGVPQDDAEAAKSNRLAADHGDATAQFKVASQYLYGLGVEQDDFAAFAWYTLAARQGFCDVWQGRDIATERMSPAEVDEAECFVQDWLDWNPGTTER